MINFVYRNDFIITKSSCSPFHIWHLNQMLYNFTIQSFHLLIRHISIAHLYSIRALQQHKYSLSSTHIWLTSFLKNKTSILWTQGSQIHGSNQKIIFSKKWFLKKIIKNKSCKIYSWLIQSSLIRFICTLIKLHVKFKPLPLKISEQQ